MRLLPSVLILVALASGGSALAKKTPKPKPVAPVAEMAKFMPPPLTPENSWNLDLSTGGRVTIQLRPDKAPQMVARVKTLTCSGFYDGLKFHRVIEGFMAQGGDPLGTGEGGSPLPNVPAEFNDLPHVRGSVAAARAEDENSANSQFYIMFQPNLKLDAHYTVFGRVVSGMQYVDAITRGGEDDNGQVTANPSTVVHASIAGGCAGIPTIAVTAPTPAAAPASPPPVTIAPPPAVPQQ